MRIWTRGWRLGLVAAALLLLAGGLAWAAADKPAVRKAKANVQSDGARLDAFWQRARETVYKSPAELAAQHAHEVRLGVRYAKLLRGDTKSPAIALTFDDGPHPEYTLKLLAILRKYHVKATFFVVGELAEQHPELIRAEVADGHLVGDHTYHHVNLTKIPFGEIATEWEAGREVIESITGQPVRYCRPPGGDYDKEVITAATDLGLTTVLWTDDPGDYASPGAKVIEKRVLEFVSNGGILLLHDGVQQTIDILPQLIETLQRRGFRFVTADELATGLGTRLPSVRRRGG
jgi:peptidoglycan-N-acetylglucosamine deacetylase